MPKKDMLVVDIDHQPEVQETKVDGAGKLNALSWLCHHVGQMAKGSTVLLGLLTFGGLGYYFGRRRSDVSKDLVSSSSLEISADVGVRSSVPLDIAKALVSDVTPTPISLISDAAITDRKIDFGVTKDAEVREEAEIEEVVLSGVKRSLMQEKTLVSYNSSAFVPRDALPKIWAKAFGGDMVDEAWSIQQTMDGGYIVAGYTNSAGAGDYDFLVLKLDSFGNKAWAKTFGGTSNDGAYSIQQTIDGGYIVAGYTQSVETGNRDTLILKLDDTGNKVWTWAFDSVAGNGAAFIKQTMDGGYIVAGYINIVYPYSYNSLVFKLDAIGNQTWAQVIEGEASQSRHTGIYSVTQTTDGEYIAAGYTGLYDYSSQYYSLLLFKLDKSGNMVWTKIFEVFSATTYINIAHSIQQTTDGGYIIAGWTYSAGAGDRDCLILKLDGYGEISWAKTFGGVATDSASFIQQTIDGEYIVAGYTNTVGSGNYDVLVFKLDKFGNKVWAKTFGGPSVDIACSVQQTADGGYIITGYTNGVGAGNYDALILKLDTNGNLRDGCWGQDVPWQTEPVRLQDSGSHSEKSTILLTLISADTLVLTDWSLTKTPICVEPPIVNIPIASQISCCATGVGQTYSFALTNNTFIDLAGGALTYNAALSSGSLLPSWLVFNPMTQTFNGTPPSASAIGDIVVKVTAINQEGGGIGDTFTLNVAQTLNATNIAALINYIENAAYKLDPIVITTPSATATTQLTLSDIAAGNFTTGTSGSVTSTYNPAIGLWQANGNRTDVNDLLGNLWYQPAIGYHGGFNVTIKITDIFGQDLHSILVAPSIVIPKITWRADTKIPLGGSLILTTDLLNVEDSSVPASSLVFTVANAAHGQFELVDNPSIAIMTFTKQQIVDKRVKITQDGSENPTTFSITVNNGRGFSAVSSITTKINHGPELDIHPDKIRLTRKETLDIATDMISAQLKDKDVPLDPIRLVFTVSDADIQYGRFEFLESSKVTVIITNFTLDNIRKGRIELVPTNEDNPPSFKISVNDGQVTDGPRLVNTKFKEPSSTSTLTTVLNIALGAGASTIVAVGWWGIKKKYSAYKRREKYPFANRIRAALNLGVNNFEADRGIEFVKTVDMLAGELREKQGIDINILTHKELQELALPVAGSIRKHTAIGKKCCSMFCSKAIDHKAVRDNVSVIANDAARKYQEVVAQQAAHARNTLTAPLISPVMGSP